RPSGCYDRTSSTCLRISRRRFYTTRVRVAAVMKRITSHLYFWVLLAIISGGVFGYLNPAQAVTLKPLGDGFIALVTMLISPVIFCTVVLGIAGAGDMRKVGRVGGKALL